MEAVYEDLMERIGFAAFAPVHPARGAMFSSRKRSGRAENDLRAAVSETDLYG